MPLSSARYGASWHYIVEREHIFFFLLRIVFALCMIAMLNFCNVLRCCGGIYFVNLFFVFHCLLISTFRLRPWQYIPQFNAFINNITVLQECNGVFICIFSTGKQLQLQSSTVLQFCFMPWDHSTWKICRMQQRVCGYDKYWSWSSVRNQQKVLCVTWLYISFMHLLVTMELGGCKPVS